MIMVCTDTVCTADFDCGVIASIKVQVTEVYFTLYSFLDIRKLVTITSATKMNVKYEWPTTAVLLIALFCGWLTASNIVMLVKVE